MISVLILTYNEEQDLPGCLHSVSWCDDIHILDSGSTDRTLDIAHAHGATTHMRPFDNFAAQRNAALHLPFVHPWVLILDADERSTPDLSDELMRLVPTLPESTAALQVRRRDYLWGRWLKHAQMTPFYVRVVRPERASYTRSINEVITIDGDIQDVRAPLDHLAFSKGITHWMTRHNLYSSQEAALLASGVATRSASLRQALFANNFHEKRVARKAIFYKLPFRPYIKWLYLVFWRGAILDGRAGLTYATLISFYEALIEAKRREAMLENSRKR